MKKFYQTLIIITVTLMVLLQSSHITGAQDKKAGLTYQVEVNVTQVEVIVTDKSGNRITGLKPENFNIYEDGVLQKLSNFFEIKEMDAYTATGKKKEPQPRDRQRPILPKPIRAQAATSVMNKIIIYFDNRQLHPLNRNWSIKKLEKFVKINIIPGQNNQCMIVSLNESLKVIQKFTTSPSHLVDALKSLKRRSGQLMLKARRKDELRNELNSIVEDSSRFDKYSGYENALDRARTFAEVEKNNLHFSLKSLSAFTTYMSGIQGRKVLIYVSDGLPINPGDEVYNFLSQAYPQAGARNEAMNFDATRLFKELTARCNANEISLYPINAKGLETRILGADKSRGWSISRKGSGMVKLGSRTEGDALRLMANETGGLAILSTNDIENGLTKIKNDLQFYYALGYRSLHRSDNQYHAIKVALKDTAKKYRVRVRQGFKQVSVVEKIKENVQSRLFIKRLSNPMGLTAKILPIESKAFSKNLRLQIKLWVPIKKLALKPRRDDFYGKIKIYVILKDSDGAISPCHELAKDVIIPKNDYQVAMRSNFPYIVEMFVAPDAYNISLAVHDVAGTTSYIQMQANLKR